MIGDINGFLKGLSGEVKDIFQNDIETSKAYVVPSREDPLLTFPMGANKKGKLIETCVLMVDIRNSTSLSKRFAKDKVKLGKIYSAFIHAMVDIADEFGYVRNIVGDRIMVVFEPGNCYQEAVHCAAMMYSVATKLLAKEAGLPEFKIGIGIDYGEMLVLKAGIRKKHEEQSEYKGLIWMGNPANIASKLCDFAAKDFESIQYVITYEYFASEQVRKYKWGSSAPGGKFATFDDFKLEPYYEWETVKKQGMKILSSSEFAKEVTMAGTTTLRYKGSIVSAMKSEVNAGTASPILMSGKVYEGFKRAEPKSPFLKELTKKIYPGQPYAESGVWGMQINLPEVTNFKG